MPASEFSDVFISYRRLDVEFVKRLVEDLQNDGKEVWVDWEDIPPGVEGFADEIKRGIEGADTFIAVLSPRYLESTYCVDMELQYAIDLKKQIIPLVFEKFEDHRIPAGISHINWIYFVPHAGQANDYDDGFPKILDVMQTDLEHVRQHKRFLLRAIEWNENNRDQSFLLNGEEIQNAQHWLAHSAGKEPIPNDLHREYIADSIKFRRRIQQMVFSGIIVALIISVVLSILSFVGFSDARVAQETAVANLDIASTAQSEAESNESIASTARANAEINAQAAQTSQARAERNQIIAQIAQEEAERNLVDARQSQSLFHGDLAQQQADLGFYQRALLLALEALKFHREGIVSDSAYGAIHTALHQPIRQVFHLDYPSEILTTIWHDNQQQILIATDKQNTTNCLETENCSFRVEIWDFMAQEQIAYLPHDFPMSQVIWDQTRNQVLTLSYDDASNVSRIILWDIATQAEVYRIDNTDFVEWMTWQEGNQHFVTGQQTQFSCGFGDQPSCNHRAVVYTVTTGEQVGEYPQDKEVMTAVFSPDEQFLAITVRDSFRRPIFVYDFANGGFEDIFGQAVNHVLWREDEHLSIVSTDTGIFAQIFGSTEPLYRISSTQPLQIVDDFLLIEQPEGCDDTCEELLLFDVRTGEEQLRTDHQTIDSVYFGAILQDQQYMLIGSNDQLGCLTCETAFYLWSLDTSEILHTFDYDGIISDETSGFALNSDESLMVTHALTNFDHHIIEVWDIETGEKLLFLDLERGTINSVQFDATDQHIIIRYADRAESYDVYTGDLEHTMNFKSLLQEVIVLHDEHLIATLTNETFNTWQVIDWDVNLHNLPNLIIAGENYNKDKSQVVTWSGMQRFSLPQPNANVWDVETGQLLYTLETDSPVMYAEWSPDRRFIAVLQHNQRCNEDCVSGTLIFDAGDGRQVATYDEYGGDGTLMWYPDSNHIIRQSDFMAIFDAMSGETLYFSDTYLPDVNQWNNDWTTFAYQNLADLSVELISYPTSEVIQTFPLTTREYDTQWGSHDEVISFLVDNAISSKTHVDVYAVESAEKLYSVEDVGIFNVSHNSELYAMYTEDRMIRIIDVATGEEQWSHETVNEDWTDLIWSPDDQMIIIAGFFASRSQLFDVATGTLIKTFPYSDVTWSPDSRLILAHDTNVDIPVWRVYDVRAARVVFSFQPSSTPQWGRTSREMVSRDGRWNVVFSDLVNRGLNKQIRDLTELELQEFFIKPPPDDPSGILQDDDDDDDDD